MSSMSEYLDIVFNYNNMSAPMSKHEEAMDNCLGVMENALHNMQDCLNQCIEYRSVYDTKRKEYEEHRLINDIRLGKLVVYHTNGTPVNVTFN